MKNMKGRLMVCLLALAVAGGAGWGTYTLAAPASSAEAEHAGHDHGKEEAEHDLHGAAGENADPHASHDHGEDDEDDLEELFGTGEQQAAGDDDDHAGHDHASPARAAAKNDPHAGHDHAAHGEVGDEICSEHRMPESEDALCQPDLVSHLQPGEGLKVRLAASQMAERIGIATARPLPAGEGGGSWPGQVVFNRDRLARLSPLAGGTVQKVNVSLGERVGQGMILAEIASPEAATMRAEATAAESRRSLAEAVYRREKDLLAKGISSRHEFEQAEAELRQAESAATRARRQLRDIGLADGAPGSPLPLRSPFAGTVIERAAAVGEAVSPGTPLFVVADLSTLWVEISVPEDALLAVQPGLAIVASFSGLPGRAFPGKVFWVAPALDERTRMLKVIAEIDNREGVLRSGLFGQVRPVRKTAGASLAVPTDALQTVDGNPFVFVRLADDLFELRRVTAGGRSPEGVVIREGVHADDLVVTAQAFSLKSEVLRARLGASCADH